MNEAYLATARKRVSLARHARLVDYHLHEGNQASTWLARRGDRRPGAVHAGRPGTRGVDRRGRSAAGSRCSSPAASTGCRRMQRQRFDPLVNRLRLHTWRDAQPALRAGSTSADVVPVVAGRRAQPEADALRDLVRNGAAAADADRRAAESADRPRARTQSAQAPAAAAALGATGRRRKTIHDPVTNTWLVRLHWRDEDALRFDYSFTTFCGGTADRRTSRVFYGNLVPVHEGRPMAVHFHEPGHRSCRRHRDRVKHRYFERLDRYGDGLDWVLAALPEGPLAYLPTPRRTAKCRRTPRCMSKSTLPSARHATRGTRSRASCTATIPPSRATTSWSRPTSASAACCASATAPTAGCCRTDAIVHADYQIGGGHAGNVGADQLVYFAAADRRA